MAHDPGPRRAPAHSASARGPCAAARRVRRRRPDVDRGQPSGAAGALAGADVLSFRQPLRRPAAGRCLLSPCRARRDPPRLPGDVSRGHGSTLLLALCLGLPSASAGAPAGMGAPSYRSLSVRCRTGTLRRDAGHHACCGRARGAHARRRVDDRCCPSVSDPRAAHRQGSHRAARGAAPRRALHCRPGARHGPPPRRHPVEWIRGAVRRPSRRRVGPGPPRS